MPYLINVFREGNIGGFFPPRYISKKFPANNMIQIKPFLHSGLKCKRPSLKYSLSSDHVMRQKRFLCMTATFETYCFHNNSH